MLTASGLGPSALFAQVVKRFEREVVGAEHHVGFELLDVAAELQAGVAGEDGAHFVERAGRLRLVRLGEHHAPQLGRVVDQVDVAVGHNLPVQRREELAQVNPLDHVIRPEGAPGFLERRSRSDVAVARSDSCNEYAHNLR